jgi:hypothetical protein
MGSIAYVRIGHVKGTPAPDLVITECVGCGSGKLQSGYVYSFPKGFAEPDRLSLPFLQGVDSGLALPNTDGVGLYAYGGGTGARAEGTATNATGLYAIGKGTGLGIIAQNLDVGGAAISAANNGQGLTNPTLRLINFQANTGLCMYASNASSWATARLDQGGAGEVIWMRKPTAGNFIVANNGTSDLFWVDSNGTTHTKVLEILGGADLSERFDVAGASELVPGTVVSIDAAHEGKLLVSSEPYDRRVAGIVSGAGGVQPGMLMGHDGTWRAVPSDRSAGPCLLSRDREQRPDRAVTCSTSPKPGYAMRVDDPARAQVR